MKVGESQDKGDHEFTEKLLRETLGERCTDQVLDAVLKAEHQLVERKDNLVDLLEAGILTPAEFAQKVNAATSVYLRFVADVIGEEACKALYDFGPDEEVMLLDPQRVALPSRSIDSATIVRTVAAELLIAGDRIKTKLEDEPLRAGLREIARDVVVRSELTDLGGSRRLDVLCWQTALVTSYLASFLEGEASRDIIWRVAEKMLAIDGWFLPASRACVDEFFANVKADVPKLADIASNAVGDFELSEAACWLWRHAKQPPQWPFHESFLKKPR